MNLPESVKIIEVGPRDGLQNEKNVISTKMKRQFIDGLMESGLHDIEISSFVSPKWVPQMGDSKELARYYAGIQGTIFLAPNKKGIETALEMNCKKLAVFVGVSDSFNKRNINKTTSESMKELEPLIRTLKNEGVFVRACISTSFYCPYEGIIHPERTVQLCKQFEQFGVDELSVADTIGMATPKESYRLFSEIQDSTENILLTAHFHDTRKMALSNIFACLQAGINRFDASAGGIGGCPFAKGATGNVATEDVVYMLERMGIRTGVNLPKLKETIQLIAPHLSNTITSGYYTVEA
ncbi:hydroxymethylglutaryl-CoA lyase [Bacillus coahuilensis p1.1.43]|uniref:Hydroxymethylglutaryl-CoA lyase n=1 Tax=Bacillus coahuilensis p1.1.43 TaxID=1150625 RepID=A0A147K863_9BACI|nr:hydroxymethylglutaryl-CoA lyase [Bacillus coahuilensis]KUP06279.1 hydroxymethylglutaryl-CoA lyase [Bacillus coahuilensis p1.1.43]